MIPGPLASLAPRVYTAPVIPEPPHIDMDPSPFPNRTYYSPEQAPLSSRWTTEPGVQFNQSGRSGFPLHIWNCWGLAPNINTRFGVQSFVTLVFFFLQVLCERWGRSLLMVVYLVLLLSAPYYAGRLRIRHPFARFVRRLFFEILTYPGDPHPPRIFARSFPLMFIGLSGVALLFWP